MYRHLQPILAASLLSMAAGTTNHAAEANVKSDQAATRARISDFLPARSVTRVGNPLRLSAQIANGTRVAAELVVRLTLPEGVSGREGALERTLGLEPVQEQEVTWEIEASTPQLAALRLEVSKAGVLQAEATVPVRFLPALSESPGTYIPEPRPAATQLLVGAHHCPLWEADKPGMWTQIRKHMERVPALGFYAQETPEVSDWETAWAVEHGISFFIYCWYRTSQGGPVQTMFSSAIHDGLLKSRYAKQMQFTIMWENQNRGRAGVADEADLMENLLPFWLETYFKHPSYLKVDNRPVLFIYRPEFLVQDLGSIENVVKAFDKMRAACRAAGFDGLTLLGEYRGLDPQHLQLMKQLGLDYTFAYCWHVANNPTPQQAIDVQMHNIRKTQELAVLPQVVTVSQAWSGWADEGSIWKIPPADFERLLEQAKDFVTALPATGLSSRMLLLDNWNEWGEGHYIAPYTEYGFGYLDAVRKILSSAPAAHQDLIPEDVGMGPYDNAYRQFVAQEALLRKSLDKHITRPGADAPGLIGWWTFDEDDDTPVAYDYSGNGLGGALRKATRATGLAGRALECQGGSVTVPNQPALSPTQALTIACRVKTDLGGQGNTWIVNHVLSGGTDTGYRLGVVQGKPCFAVPQTEWSHHLKGEADLPTGRWVHLAGTFDGTTMRLYVDGVECGTMARPGPLKPNAFPLCLGSYEAGHEAHFTGLLDEVRLYDRALSAAEIQRQAQEK
jgi:hypothetical protein